MRLNAVIICDDSESNDLKPLFSNLMCETSQALCAYKEANNIDLTLANLTHEIVDVKSLSERLSSVNQNAFLCYVYSHGDCDKVLMDGESIVSTTLNQYVFTNAVIYTFSCCNGGELADALIGNGAKLFVGYTDDAWFTTECENDFTGKIAMRFVNSFLEGNDAQQAFEDLKDAYNSVIFDDSFNDPILKGNLRKNRECLTLKGDGKLKITDVLLN